MPEFNVPVPNSGSVPPHFHKEDRISAKDLIPDDTVYPSLPVSAEEGKIIVVGSGGAYSFYQYLDGDWRPVGLITLDTITGGPLPIAKGGTGQDSLPFAFGALSPLTNKGDIITHDGTNNVRKAVGSNNEILVADSSDTSGWKFTKHSKIGVGTTDVAVTTKTAETNLFSVTVPGNTLGTNGALWMRINFDNFRATNLATFRGYFGTTAMCSASVGNTNGQTLSGHLDFFLYGDGTTAAQDGNLEVVGDINGYQITADSFRVKSDGTATENSVNDLFFKVTIQFATSSSLDKITFRNGHAVKFF